MRWPWQRRERRDSGGDFSDAVVRLIEAQAAGTAADASSTAAVEAAAGALSRAFASAEVVGPAWVQEAVSPGVLAQVGRDLIRSGDSMHVIRMGGDGMVRLIPASSWHWEGSHDPATWTVRVTAYGPCPSHLFHPSQKPWNFASPPDTLSGMHKIIEIFADRAALHTEILALRQQVAVLKRKRPRPLLRKADRVFWVILSCLWPGWRHALVIVRPETVIGWHRKGFRLFWTWKSRRRKPGRPPVSREIRYLVRRMSRENTRWGAPRIHGELLKLGFSISQAAVSKYMVRYPSPPSQSWRTFLTNHADCLASIDFFVVPTATFHLLFGFIVLHHERRQIVHFGVTANPTMAWVAQQIREAFPWGTAPRYLIRDRDGAYGQSFRSTVTAMGVEEVVTAPRSPWQNPYVERLIGSVRRECLDHSIILNERHLRRILGSYLDYYHGSRTHLSLGKDTPDGRPVQPAGSGTVVSLPKVGGLHHRYERLAA